MFGLDKFFRKNRARVVHPASQRPMVPVAKSPPVAAPEQVAKPMDPAATNKPVRKPGGSVIVMAEDVLIENTTQLAQIWFDRCINEELSLPPHLQAKVAILETKPNSKEVKLLWVKEASRESLEEIARHLLDRRYTFPPNEAQGYYCVPTIVALVSKGHIEQRQLAVLKDAKKSAFWQAFVDIVQWAFVNGADDLDFIISVDQQLSQVKFLISGEYLAPARFALPTSYLQQVLGVAWQQGQGTSHPDFRLATEQQCLVNVDLADNVYVRLRWSGMPLDIGCAVTQRIQRKGGASRIQSLEATGYDIQTLSIMRRSALTGKGGLVLFSGEVGSGKTTSLAALIREYPANSKIISFEDPVEIELPNVLQKTIARDMSSIDHDEGFERAARTIFRSGLHAFYLSEVRDKASGRTARLVVESGHKTFSTTHATGCLQAIDKLASPEIGVPMSVLGTPGNMRLSVYQALLKTVCPDCGKSPVDYAQHFKLQGQELERHQRYFGLLESLYDFDSARYRLTDHRGCPTCKAGREEMPVFWGTANRTVVYELFEPDSEAINFLLKGDKISLVRYWRSLAAKSLLDDDPNGRTVMDCALWKASKGMIDPRVIEVAFGSFEQVAARRARYQKMMDGRAGENTNVARALV